MNALKIFSITVLLIVAGMPKTFAQDDVYYDPAQDKSTPNPQQQYENGNSGTSTSESTTTQSENTPAQTEADKTDGYGNPAEKYDPRDNYSSGSNNDGSYSTDAGYYDEDYDTYFYTTRLRRYYAPNYGTSYYSYWYTPSYYVGLSSWNSPYVVSYSPWYNDPWWRWNRRHTTVVVYDPFYSPYWSWNFGWNTGAYYNSWSNPYWGYGPGCFGYGGGYGYGGSYGYGGYGCGYGGYGYGGGYGGYCNGYYSGYYNGYNDGYWGSTAYNNSNSGYNYYGPRHRNSTTETTSTGTPVVQSPRPNGGMVKPTNNTAGRVNEIPKEGITRPLNPSANVPATNSARPTTNKPAVNGAAQPVQADRGVVVAKPVEETPASHYSNPSVEAKPNNGVNMPNSGSGTPANDNGRYNQGGPGNTRPFVQQSEPQGWHDVPAEKTVPNRQPSTRPANTGNVQQQWGDNQVPPNVNRQPQNQNGGWNRTSPPNVQQRPAENTPPQRTMPQQQQARPQMQQQQQARPQMQQQQRERPQMQQQPQARPQQQQYNRMERPNNSYSAPQQRSVSPAPQRGGSPSGGGGFRRH